MILCFIIYVLYMGKKVSMKSSTNANTNTSNGGIMGSGVFGMFGTIIQCKAEDSSLYCSFMKIFNVMIVVLVILVILYAVYSFMSIKKRR